MASDDASAPSGNAALPTHAELLDSLKEVITDVFSSMFITVSAMSHETDASTTDVSDSVGIEVEVEFSGALDGAVVLRCSGRGAEDIARGLLMMDDGDAIDLAEVKDALGECGNMVTGTLKTKALDPVAEFRMGIPVVRDLAASAGVFEDRRLAYQLSRGFMTAELWVRDASGAGV